VCFDRLKKIPLTEVADDEVVPPLEVLLADLFALERDLALARKDFLFTIEDHPSIRNHAQPVTSLIRRIERISDRNLMLEHPEKFPEQTNLAHLRGAKETLTELRREADAMVDHVLEQKKRIDEILASIIENFAPERIMPVDRAILRLCTAEFLLRPSTNPRIEINEAIDLAKKYGSEDSGRFVNGVLDAVARALQPQQSPA
jgi:N utilization substance protein B